MNVIEQMLMIDIFYYFKPQGYFKVLGKGNLPNIPLVVKAKFFSKEVRKKFAACVHLYVYISCYDLLAGLYINDMLSFIYDRICLNLNRIMKPVINSPIIMKLTIK